MGNLRNEVTSLIKFAATILIALVVAGFVTGVSLALVDKIFGIHLQQYLNAIAFGLSTVIVLSILLRDLTRAKSRNDGE